MNISVTDEKGYVVARLDGGLEEDVKAAFDESLHPLVVDRRHMLIDLGGVERVTSAGLGHLVTLVSRANTKNTHVVLARPTTFVNSILNVTKLTRFFDIEETLEAGIAKLRELNAETS